ncbi:unnamed protein product [Trichobilharzia regenti]|nr:unnamed protein product [Trichobilharzia regenti]
MLGYSNSSDFQKIGLGLLAFGVGFLCLGVLFFFDAALLALGNVLFLAGIGCLIGLQKACTFFFRRTSLKGAAFFFGGIAVVLFGFPFIGMLLEIYGMINLFSPMNNLFNISVPRKVPMYQTIHSVLGRRPAYTVSHIVLVGPI